jgi:predicted dehydrogenase
VHLREIDRLAGLGRARLVCCADVVAPDEEQAAIISRLGAKYYVDWRDMVEAQTGLDVLVVASPPHLHAEMCRAAVESGTHVLVEKPPVVSIADFTALDDAVTRSGVLCQVGFQSTGSGALARIREIVADGELGHPARVVATGSWQRDRRYWARSEWAGKDVLRGVPVHDGAICNPFAHAVMNCLVAVGADGDGPLSTVEAERYRANAIEVDDTASISVTSHSGASFVVAVTLCAERSEPPKLQVSGRRGHVAWTYESDTITYDVDGRHWEEPFSRRSLLEELIVVAGGQEGADGLSCPLERTRRFVDVVEAVCRRPVKVVQAEHVRWEGEESTARAVIVGVGSAVQQAAATSELFSQQGAPWAVSAASPHS